MPGSGKGEQSHAILYYLTSIGIHVQPGKTSPCQEKKIVSSPAGGLFGVPLHLLPLSDRVKGVPQFLVDACELLRPHLHVEGLFRKCGSMTRIKALKTRLEAGERCLQMALPCDVATLVKQFLRGLPEPLIPVGLQGPLCLAQQREEEEDGQGALMLLLTSLLPQRNADTLRYLCGFLQDAAARCAQNKMDLANLAVVFAPNLFSNELCSQLGKRTEEQLQAQVAVVQALLSHASEIGMPPQPLMEKVQAAFSDMEIKGLLPPRPEDAGESGREERRRRRRSVSNIVTEALSKFKTGRALCTAPCPESKEDSSDITALQTAFISKRKASDDIAWTPSLLAKKRRSALDSLSSNPFDEDADDVFDQPADAGPVQASTSPVPVFSGGTFNALSETGGRPANSWTPPVKVQRKRSSSQKRPQRRRSVRTSPCRSPMSFECKSMRIFSRNSKDLASPSQQLPHVSAKAAEPSGWLWMKKTVTVAREGLAAQQRWPQLQSYKLKDSEAGSLLQPSSNNTSAPTGANPGVPHALKCDAGTGPSPCLDGLTSGLRRLDLDALLGSRELSDTADALAGDTRPSAPATSRHHRVLRRSMSWPEELSVRDAAEEGAADFSPDDVPPVAGGREAQTSSLAELPQSGAGVVVAGTRQLGIPAVCVNLANSCMAGCVENQGPPRDLPQSSLPSKPGLPDARRSLARRLRCLSKGPKTGLKQPAHNVPHTLSQPEEGASAVRLSPSRHKGGRRFGRSVSHESALPLQAGQEGGHTRQLGQAKRGASMQPSKSPLQAFKACGQQIFITRKHIMMSFAGLRGKREETSPRDAELLSPDCSTC